MGWYFRKAWSTDRTVGRRMTGAAGLAQGRLFPKLNVSMRVSGGFPPSTTGLNSLHILRTLKLSKMRCRRKGLVSGPQQHSSHGGFALTLSQTCYIAVSQESPGQTLLPPSQERPESLPFSREHSWRKGSSFARAWEVHSARKGIFKGSSIIALLGTQHHFVYLPSTLSLFQDE